MSIVHVPFYPSDWLAGTRGLTDAETGVYITLIARMYEMAGPIERDDNRLARLCGSKTKSSFVKALDYLISEGKIIASDEGLFNERVEKEIKNTTEKSEKAKAAAQSRWDRKSNKNNDGRNADASAEHMPRSCQSEPKPYIDTDTNVSVVKLPPAVDEISKAIQYFNVVAKRAGWPEVKKVSSTRRSSLKARIKDAGGLSEWMAAMDRAEKSSFLTGGGERGWRANFDFLAKPSKFTGLIEGSYDDQRSTGRTSDNFHDQFDAALGGKPNELRRENEIDSGRVERISAPLQATGSLGQRSSYD